MGRNEKVTELLGGKPLFGAGKVVPGKVLRRVRSGLPYKTFEKVRDSLQLDTERMQRIVGMPARTLARRKVQRTLTKEESDRVYRVARIAALAADVFGDEPRAYEWLRRPNRALEDSAPVDLLDTDVGAQQVEMLLGRIDHGIFG